MIKMESLSEKREIITINREDLLIIVGGFLISRVDILNKLTPFGLAYLAASYLMKRENFWLPLTVFTGLFTVHGLGGANYYLSVLGLHLVMTRLIREQEENLAKGAALVGVSFFILQFGLNILSRSFDYDLFVMIFESILVFTMTYVFSYGLPLERLKLDKVKNEQLVCSLIILALMISGLNNMALFQVNLKNIISLSLIIFIAYKEGILLGLGLSVVLGLLSYLSQVEMPFILSILVAGGLLAGLFRELGRLGSILGFGLGNAIISFYINNYGTSFFSYRELLIASFIFLIGDYFIKVDLGAYLDGKKEVIEKYEKQREDYIIRKLDKNIEAFTGISRIFRESASEDKLAGQDDLYDLVDQVSSKLCKACPNYGVCWQENYYESYKNLFRIISFLEAKVDKETILLGSSENTCKERDKLIDEASRLYNLFKERQFFNNKILEQRRLIADQIENLAKTMDDFKLDLRRQPIFHRDLEDELIRELKNRRIDILEVLVVEVEDKQIDLLMKIEDRENSNQEIEKIRKIASNFLDMDFSVDYKYGHRRDKIRSFKLTKSNRFNTLTRTSYESNSEKLISGDNHSFGEIGSRAYIAISDGMGIGKKASEESAIAIELMEKLMETNMDKSTIVRTINSILRSKSSDEILNLAKLMGSKGHRDDMTVIASKIWKNL